MLEVKEFQELPFSKNRVSLGLILSFLFFGLNLLELLTL